MTSDWRVFAINRKRWCGLIYLRFNHPSLAFLFAECNAIGSSEGKSLWDIQNFDLFDYSISLGFVVVARCQYCALASFFWTFQKLYLFCHSLTLTTYLYLSHQMFCHCSFLKSNTKIFWLSQCRVFPSDIFCFTNCFDCNIGLQKLLYVKCFRKAKIIE